jgi:hypothetical protein
LFVKVLDGLAVPPRAKVKPELSHVLEVRLYLLLRSEPKGFHTKFACPVNVALLHMRRTKRGEQPWPGLDYARVEGRQGRCQHFLCGVRLSKPGQCHASLADKTVGVEEGEARPAGFVLFPYPAHGGLGLIEHAKTLAGIARKGMRLGFKRC